MTAETTLMSLAMIKDSAHRCYKATGSKHMIVFISKSMFAGMDDHVLGVFGDLTVIDKHLPGFACYTRPSRKL